MTFSSFLANLVIPVNLFIFFLLVGAVLYIVRRRKMALIVAVTGFGWAMFWSLPASSLWAGGRLEQMYPPRPAVNLPMAEAIVVLGGSTANSRENWFQTSVGEATTSRVDTAGQLYEAGRAPLIVLSGAALDGSTSEARTMANRLRQQGVPEQALLLETRSLTTRENGVYTAELLRKQHIDDVLLVTSALHMPRAMAVFRKMGVEAIAAPAPAQIVVPAEPGFSFWVPNMRALLASRSIVKEYVALLVYWMRGWI